MAWGGRLAFETFGWGFITSREWDAVGGHFGALVPIYGTLATSIIALLIAVPVSIGIALFLTDIAPRWLRAPIGTAVELLAAIPSIIYGMWGLFVFAPFMAAHVEPWLNDMLGPLPVIGALFTGPPIGIGLLTASIVLGIMIIPFITAVARDVFNAVPHLAQGSGGRARLDALGNPQPGHAALHALGDHRRDLPRPRPRARRDDGGDLRARQCARSLGLAADAEQLDRRRDRQRVHRGRQRPLSLVADRARLPAVRRHLPRPHAPPS